MKIIHKQETYVVGMNIQFVRATYIMQPMNQLDPAPLRGKLVHLYF